MTSLCIKKFQLFIQILLSRYRNSYMNKIYNSNMQIFLNSYVNKRLTGTWVALSLLLIQ